MDNRLPHYLLFTDVDANQDDEPGAWHFALESLDGEDGVDASDAEPDVCGERLELLAVVRGLEALDQQSRVTLVTPSRYVSRGLRFGLERWRSEGWKWERHGWMVPVKNADLWQRVDRALAIHDVQCRQWRIDLAHGVPSPHTQSDSRPADIGQEAVAMAEPADMGKNLQPDSAASVRASRTRSAASAIIRTVRDKVATAMQGSSNSDDFVSTGWSLAR